MLPVHIPERSSVHEHRDDEYDNRKHDDPLPDFLLIFGGNELKRDASVGINDIPKEGS